MGYSFSDMKEAGQSAEFWDEWWKARLSKGTGDTHPMLPAPLAEYRASVLTPVRYLESFFGPVGQESADQQTQAPAKTEKKAREATVAFGPREVA